MHEVASGGNLMQVHKALSNSYVTGFRETDPNHILKLQDN